MKEMFIIIYRNIFTTISTSVERVHTAGGIAAVSHLYEYIREDMTKVRHTAL